jgi:hypothetical protein
LSDTGRYWDETHGEEKTGGPVRPDPGPAEPDPEAAAPEREAGDGAAVFGVTVSSGARGVLVGDNSTQVNIEHLHVTTWTDGVAPEPLVASSGEVESPYRGLDAFGEADAGFFFGRDSAVDDVLGRLANCASRADGAGLLVLSGVSGAGKTSLLQAGVLPRLRQRGLPRMPERADRDAAAGRTAGVHPAHRHHRRGDRHGRPGVHRRTASGPGRIRGS